MTRSKWNWMIALFLFAACTLIAIPAVAQQQVDVVNGKGHPVPVLDATQPYEETCNLSFNGGYVAGCFFKQIPPRKRLIIQEFDSALYVEQGLQPNYITLITGNVEHFFTSTFMGGSAETGDSFFATHQETRLYVAPGGQPICEYLVSENSNGGAYCQISGYLVDVP